MCDSVPCKAQRGSNLTDNGIRFRFFFFFIGGTFDRRRSSWRGADDQNRGNYYQDAKWYRLQNVFNGTCWKCAIICDSLLVEKKDATWRLNRIRFRFVSRRHFRPAPIVLAGADNGNLVGKWLQEDAKCNRYWWIAWQITGHDVSGSEICTRNDTAARHSNKSICRCFLNDRRKKRRESRPYFEPVPPICSPEQKKRRRARLSISHWQQIQLRCCRQSFTQKQADSNCATLQHTVDKDEIQLKSHQVISKSSRASK